MSNRIFTILLGLIFAAGTAVAGNDTADGEAIPLGVDQDAAQVGQLPEDASFAEVDINSDGLISEEEA